MRGDSINMKQAVILSGGLGTRLKPFTEIIPKPLLPVGGKAVLEIQIGRLKAAGFTDVYLATNYKSDYIEKFFRDGTEYGVNLHISRERIPLGTVGPLSLLKSELNDSFLVMNGDILTDMDFSKFYEFSVKQDSLLTVAIKEITLPFEFGNIIFEGDRVVEVEEKPIIRKWALAGIYVFSPKILEYVPSNEKYNMDQLMRGLLSKGEPISKYEMEEYWLDIGRDADYKKAQDIFLEES